MVRWFVDRLPQRGIPSVSLRRLLPGAHFGGCPDWEVSGCTADSRRLEPGQVFVAVRGPRHDGHAFVGQALERGAAGVVVERPCPEAGRLQVVVADTRAAYARLCHALAGDPAEGLHVVGVAGTHGRTAAALFLRSIHEASGVRFGLVGPFGWSDGVATRPVGASAARPEALAAMLAEMVERGCAGGVVEVADDDPDGHGTEGVRYDSALVTDLAGSHDSDREALWARRRSAARLLRKVIPGGATIINADDPDVEVLGAANLDARRVSFGLERPADVTARIVRLDASGSKLVLRGFDREAAVELRLAGRRNVSHALAAAAAAWSRGLPLDAVVAGLEGVTIIPGRLEAIDIEEGQEFGVWIDQARRGVELEHALASLRSTGADRIHLVFGAEGNGDRATRQALARAAEAGADLVILTTDNPRTEDPDAILDDLLSGFRRPGRVRIEPDRRHAIEIALSLASPGDAVLIAGKGRHSFQILADRALPFDDKAVVAQWLRNRHRPERRASA
jgi:UDP-N-acetylmuramoyl-L-alanyl-D-glutamate--2,6-diaminopimelate ligase